MQVYAGGTAIESSLKQLAERRTDIFGVGDEETVIGKKLGEEETRKDERVSWDGHTSSVEAATRAARANITLEDQIHQIHKVKGLLPDEEKEKIGPKPVSGGGPNAGGYPSAVPMSNVPMPMPPQQSIQQAAAPPPSQPAMPMPPPPMMVPIRPPIIPPFPSYQQQIPPVVPSKSTSEFYSASFLFFILLLSFFSHFFLFSNIFSWSSTATEFPTTSTATTSAKLHYGTNN